MGNASVVLDLRVLGLGQRSKLDSDLETRRREIATIAQSMAEDLEIGIPDSIREVEEHWDEFPTDLVLQLREFATDPRIAIPKLSISVLAQLFWFAITIRTHIPTILAWAGGVNDLRQAIRRKMVQDETRAPEILEMVKSDSFREGVIAGRKALKDATVAPLTAEEFKSLIGLGSTTPR